MTDFGLTFSGEVFSPPPHPRAALRAKAEAFKLPSGPFLCGTISFLVSLLTEGAGFWGPSFMCVGGSLY